MTYIAPADFRLGTLQPWCSNLALGEGDATDALITLVIATMTTEVELDLGDDFEPPNPDVDQTLDMDGTGSRRLYLPRRVRSLTSVSTRADDGTLTAQPTTLWRLHKSLNAAGTAMDDVQSEDYLQILSSKSLTVAGPWWPFGTQTIQLVGKFGWAAVPDDIKRLVALRTYGFIRSSADPLTTIVQRTTNDAVLTFGPSTEEAAIVQRYQRALVAVG